MHKLAVVVPNWNGLDHLAECLDSLLAQTAKAEIVVVENGSIDGSVEFLAKHYPSVTTLLQPKNLGFDGGVNVGIRHAIAADYDFVALFNNDAVADEHWLGGLLAAMDNATVGITTCKFMTIDRDHLDSTGDIYSVWGLSYPRGRGKTDLDAYDHQTEIFGATGGASLYRISMLHSIGLFDEDFFAYYEDIDISFRAQLNGWRVCYVPGAVAYHHISATSSKIKGFSTYHTMKNQPLVLFKNVPRRFIWSIGWRFTLAYKLFFLRAIMRGHGWYALKGFVMAIILIIKKIPERRRIQGGRTATDQYIWSILTHDLPPNAHNLRTLRARYWKLVGKS